MTKREEGNGGRRGEGVLAYENCRKKEWKTRCKEKGRAEKSGGEVTQTEKERAGGRKRQEGNRNRNMREDKKGEGRRNKGSKEDQQQQQKQQQQQRGQ